MVHYRLPFKENWNKEMKKLLVEDLSKKLKISLAGCPCPDCKNDGTSPYIEFDDKEVRIRRLTHLPEKEQNKIMKSSEVIYKTFVDGEENVKKTITELEKQGMIIGEGNDIHLTQKGNKIAEELMKKLNPTERKMIDVQLAGKKVWTCPRCHKETEDFPALSRVDNKTKICSDCGTEEGLIPYLKKGRSLPLELGIPENDRLINYQILKGFAERIYLGINKEKMIENPNNPENRNLFLFDYWLSPVLENGMLFQVDDEDVGMTLLNDYLEGESPYQTMIIDCKFPLEDKTFYCLGMGSYYTENNVHYRAITTCYEQNGKMYLAMFALDKFDVMGDNGFNLNPKEVKQLRSVVFGCFSLFNEQEVKRIQHAENPKNNVRRQQRGRMTLPTYVEIRITGELKQYAQRISTGIKRRGYNHKFWVRGTYMHFLDKKKHKRLYAMKEDETELFKERTTKNKDGSIQKWKYKKDKNGIIVRWRRAFEKGQGLHIKQMYKYEGK